MKTTDDPIVVEEIFTNSPTELWNAITKSAQMRQWFFDNIESFRPEVGFGTQFEVYSGGRKFTHCWKVTEVIVGQKITYNWKYKEYPGDSYVTFELIQKENQVKLKLVLKVVEDFPSDIPEFERESGVQGWDYFIRKQLKAYLDSSKL